MLNQNSGSRVVRIQFWCAVGGIEHGSSVVLYMNAQFVSPILHI